jgi:Na+-transporting methylmalonyl-CoA/oxaloacetate decarboxylase gamma subunit
METERLIQKREIIVAVGIMIFLAIAVTFIPAFIPNSQIKNQYSVLIWFFGINSVLIVLGTMSLAFYIIRQWINEFAYHNRHVKKQEEEQKQHNWLIEEVETRRAFDRERNQINDMFRLFELAKEKPEEITDKTKEKEEGEVKKQINKDVFTKKNEIMNTDKLANLIDQYQKFIPKQPSKTS